MTPRTYDVVVPADPHGSGVLLRCGQDLLDSPTIETLLLQLVAATSAYRVILERWVWGWGWVVMVCNEQPGKHNMPTQRLGDDARRRQCASCLRGARHACVCRAR